MTTDWRDDPNNRFPYFLIIAGIIALLLCYYIKYGTILNYYES